MNLFFKCKNIQLLVLPTEQSGDVKKAIVSNSSPSIRDMGKKITQEAALE